NTLLEWSGPLSLRNQVERKGIIVSETSIEASTLMITAMGRLRTKSPEPSGKNTSGKNAITKVTVQPTTESEICLVAFNAASCLENPSLIQRSIFSTTTMLSSTSSPSATTRPTILS